MQILLRGGSLKLPILGSLSLPIQTLGYWASTLKGPKAVGSDLVEVGRAEIKEQRPSSPIELIVEGRYLLRLWPGMEPGHMQAVLSVLESRA